MRQITVDTWLDKPENKVTLEVSFQSLPDGTNYAAATVLTIPEKTSRSGSRTATTRSWSHRMEPP